MQGKKWGHFQEQGQTTENGDRIWKTGTTGHPIK